MKRQNTEQLGSIVRRFLRSAGLETPLNEHRLANAWYEVAGAAAAGYTRKAYVSNRTLYVEVRSPALRSNLFMRRAELVRRLNAFVGADVISAIKFV